MRRLVLALALVLSAAPARAQEELPPLTEADGWRSSLTASLQFSQAAYRNWQEGGLDALSLTASTSGRFERVLGPFKQAHAARLAFGLLKQDTLDLRKADDVIRYAFDLQYTAAGPLRPTFATELRTQFAPGFDYDPDSTEYPALAGRIAPGRRLKVSDFFAPAVWTQSLGLTVEPAPWYRARFGLGAKETIVAIERLRPVYGNDPDEPVRFEAGLEALGELRREVLENVLLEARLGLFQAFSGFGEAPDAFFESTLTMQVNSFLNVTLDFEALLDRDVSDDLQLREVLAVGVSVALLRADA